tara:strand:- start:204 stop:431 length:228 start_codon:yes stop_codon:yes gene_type:complete
VALNDPTPIMHQNMVMMMKKMSEEKKSPVEDKGGLLGPRKPMNRVSNELSIEEPKLRVASYMEQIQTKREEMKNG